MGLGSFSSHQDIAKEHFRAVNIWWRRTCLGPPPCIRIQDPKVFLPSFSLHDMSAIGLAYLRNILTQTQTQKAGSASSPHSVGESGLLVRPGGPRPSAGQTVGVETARPVTRANALGFVSDETEQPVSYVLP